jgi:hypothetical protein
MRNHTESIWKVALLSVLLIGTISCGADTSTQTTDAVNQSQSAATTDFTATLIGESSINLQAELQKSPVAMWFWAPG